MKEEQINVVYKVFGALEELKNTSGKIDKIDNGNNQYQSCNSCKDINHLCITSILIFNLIILDPF